MDIDQQMQNVLNVTGDDPLSDVMEDEGEKNRRITQDATMWGDINDDGTIDDKDLFEALFPQTAAIAELGDLKNNIIEAIEKDNYKDAAILMGLGAASFITGIGAPSRRVQKGVQKQLVSKIEPDTDVIKFRNNPEQIAEWEKVNKVSQQRKQIPEVVQAASDLYERKIPSRKWRDTVKQYNPIKLITVDNFPDLTTKIDIAGALGGGKQFKLLDIDVDIPDGTVVGARFDIPAYERYDKWVVTLHEGGKGAPKAYGQVAVLKGGIEFKGGKTADTALGIARGRKRIRKGKVETQGKDTIGRMEGKFYNEDPQEVHKKAYDIVANPDKYPEWTQVGFNPDRQSQFYIKDTAMPVFEADEVIQVGPLVLAKGAKKPTRNQLRQLRVTTGRVNPTTGLDEKVEKLVVPYLSDKKEIEIEDILDSYSSIKSPITAKEVHKQLKEIGFKINLRQPKGGPTGSGVWVVENIKDGTIYEIGQTGRTINVKGVEGIRFMHKGGILQ